MNWIVIIGGFCTPEAAYAAEMSEIKKAGNGVFFIGHNKDVKFELELRNVKEADFVVYSYNDRMLRFAKKHPGMVKRLILVNPSGLIGEDTTTKFLFRFARQMIEEACTIFRTALLNPQILLTVAKVVWSFIGLSSRNLKEVPSIAHSNIVPLLLELKQCKVEVILLHACSDRVFPQERIVKTLGEDPFKLIASWSMFIDKDASHNVSYIKKPGALRQILGW
ncbi:hypothetical protein KKG08_01680 [Patescibacteria group bacterium]|nr:hypothetical protein [Patescibacteria group bacterium]